jgi:endonuclease YncB( thermonuclease family)
LRSAFFGFLCAAVTLVAVTFSVALSAADLHRTHPFDALVVGVHDGDTITVLRDRQRIRVRLHGIDCPELGQPFGRPAKRLTSSLVFQPEMSTATAAWSPSSSWATPTSTSSSSAGV